MRMYAQQPAGKRASFGIEVRTAPVLVSPCTVPRNYILSSFKVN